jgi:hypothetical protein
MDIGSSGVPCVDLGHYSQHPKTLQCSSCNFFHCLLAGLGIRNSKYVRTLELEGLFTTRLLRQPRIFHFNYVRRYGDFFSQPQGCSLIIIFLKIGPLLLLALFQMVNFLHTASHLLVEVKREELKRNKGSAPNKPKLS